MRLLKEAFFNKLAGQPIDLWEVYRLLYAMDEALILARWGVGYDPPDGRPARMGREMIGEAINRKHDLERLLG